MFYGSAAQAGEEPHFRLFSAHPALDELHNH